MSIKTIKLAVSITIMLLFFSIGNAYGVDLDYEWKVSNPKDSFKDWNWNEIVYTNDTHKVDDDGKSFEFPSEEQFQRLKEYVQEGYIIKYRIKFEYKDIDTGNLKVYFGDQDEENAYEFDRGGEAEKYFDEFYYEGTNGGKIVEKPTGNCFTSEKSEIDRFSDISKLALWVDPCGGGEDNIEVKDIILQFAILDEVPPKITGMKYYDSYYDYKSNPDSYIKSSDDKKLSYTGSNNYVDMVIEFDEDVELTNDQKSNYIETNMTIGEDGKASFVYIDQDYLPDNTLVFRYTVSYGDYAREVDREGLENKHNLKLIGKTALLRDLENYSVKDIYDNDIGDTITDDHYYYPVDNCNITIDGDPPEITEVVYNVIGDNGRYLNAGDILEMKVKLGNLLDDERISVSSSGKFTFNNDAQAYLYDPQSSYGKNDWIIYRYTVSEDDENTNHLKHIITGNPTDNPQDYADQVYTVARNMGIRDDYGNVARMQKTGEDRYATLLFPPVKNNDQNIFIDTTAPKVNFKYENNNTYKQEQIVNVKPEETGSMLNKDGFYYVINKNPNHPTNGELANTLGNEFYPYTRSGDDPNSGYSDTSKKEDVAINDDLHYGKEGYKQYDERYDPINMTGIYEGVNYETGTASDVLYENRREITGAFYIHTYLEDLAGNKSWQTSEPVYVDNTHSSIKLAPIGTNQYVGDLDIEFELLKEDHSGHDRYEYRWITPLDLEENSINKTDIYIPDTYTYKLLRDNSKYWKTVDSLDGYSKSNIPIPSFDKRQHGASYIAIRAYDNAANESYIVSEPYYFDKKKPVVKFESLNDGFDNPVENHKVRITVDDEHSKLIEFKYYFSNSNLTRDKNNEIWEQLDLNLPDLPEDYDPLSDKDYGDLITKEAFLDTANWDKEILNGYTFLHVYGKDICGNEIIEKQDLILDNNGLPIISFDYDNAIGNRYKTVVGHIKCTDDGGIETLEYKWSKSTEHPQTYEAVDITGMDNKKLEVDTPEFSEDGEWYLHVRAKDTYGNVTNSVSEKYTISSKSPNIDLFKIDNKEAIISKDRDVALTINKLEDDKLEYTYVVFSDEACTDEVKRGTFSSTSEIVNITLDDNTSEIQDYYFRFYDSLEQITENTIKIEAIYDNAPPTAELVYSPSNEEGITDGSVTVKLNNISDNSSDEDDINVSEKEYTFTENGEHVFKLRDKAGNENTYVAKVTWIQDDKPIVRLNTNNTYGQHYKSIDFILTAQRPTDSGYVDIENPEIYYQFTKDENAVEESWVKYNNGDIITFDKENSDGEYYLHTKLVYGERSFTNAFGKFVLDNTIKEPELTYSYSEAGKLKELSQEEYNDIAEIISSVTVKLSFDEDVIINSVINSEENELPKQQEIIFDKNDIITVTYMDKAGNEGSKAIEINNINNKNAGIFTITPNTVTNEEVTVKITAPDDKRINNICFNDEVVDTNKITFTKSEVQGEAEDKNYITAEFKVAENGTIKADVFEINSTEAIDTINYSVTSIDKIAPVGEIKVSNPDKHTILAAIEITDESPTSVTKVEFIKEDDTTIEFNPEESYEDNDVIYNNITHTVTTKINGTVKYYFEDSAGNIGEAEKNINTINTEINLDNVYATYEVDGIEYDDIKEIGVVNKDVKVILYVPDGYYIVNNSGKDTRTFVVGMKYDFLISNGINIDKYSVDLTGVIKKSGPVLNLNYTIDGENYVNKLINGKTSKNVLLTITSDDDISKVSFNGVEVNNAPFSYEFTENKVITVVATDTSGNTSTIKASVDCIDKEPVRAGLFSLDTRPTNASNIMLQFLATKPVDIMEVLKNGNKYKEVENGVAVDKYEFCADDNGTYSVKYKDNIGNENIVDLVVSNFDREKPQLQLLYNGQTSKVSTNEDVLVTVALVNKEQEPDGIRVLNTIGNINSYLFKENGTFRFRVADAAGNISEIEATIDNIDRDPPSYTISYSETDLTKEDVIASVNIDEDDFIILNKDIDSNKNITVDDRKIEINFDDNGYYQLKISDEAGNSETVLLRVRNIDRIKPTIEFLNDYVVTLKGENPELNDFIAYDTHSGNVDDKVKISRLDTSTQGDKKITYTVSDEAGNEMKVDRIVKVIGDDFTVVVDGKENPDPFISTNKETDIRVYNFIESFKTKYIKGSGAVKDGEFKQGGQVFNVEYDTIDDGKPGKNKMKFSVDKPGWYTIYIKDLNRQTVSFTIYFTKTK